MISRCSPGSFFITVLYLGTMGSLAVELANHIMDTLLYNVEHG